MDTLRGGFGGKGAHKGAGPSSDQGFWGGFGGQMVTKIVPKTNLEVSSIKIRASADLLQPYGAKSKFLHPQNKRNWTLRRHFGH